MTRKRGGFVVSAVTTTTSQTAMKSRNATGC
jgi:hypothetical protein